MNYYDERKQKIINESQYVDFTEKKYKKKSKNNNLKKIYITLFLFIIVVIFSFFVYRYENNKIKNIKNIKSEVLNIKKISNPDKYLPIVKHPKNKAASTNPDWIVETPADIKQIEEKNGINSPPLIVNKIKSKNDNKQKIKNNKDGLLALSSDNKSHQVIIDKTKENNNFNKKPITNNINNNTTKEENKKNNNQDMIKSKSENPQKIVINKQIKIPPQIERNNSIFAIAPKVKLTSSGWRLAEIYKDTAIITNPKGKNFAVKVGSFIDGHEVLSIKKNEVYLTGNILIK